MRKIIVLAVIGILSDARKINDTQHKTTRSHKITKCADVAVQPNFDSERYFKGTWYLTYAQRGPPFSVCRTLRTTLKPNGTLDHTIYVYRQRGRMNDFYTVRCHGNEKKGKGRLSLSCNIQEFADNKNPMHIEGVVMETDYDHYAIFYRCTWRSKNKRENVLIFNRKKNDTSKDPVIAKSLKKKGLVLDQFASRRKSGCVPHPEE